MQHIKHKMSTLRGYEYLLVIRVMSCLKLKNWMFVASREFEVCFFYVFWN